uniref:Putative nuclease HARBI1 n=1 Tax=Diabrotica virgifera virgifera TaxID=50390 RepID=A0A6P7H1J5_DIAVI
MIHIIFYKKKMDIFNDDLDLLEIIEHGFPRRVFVRPNYFQTMDNLTFFRTFRFYKETVLFILTLIEDRLEFPDNRNNSLSPMNQLLTCLRYFASSGFLITVAQFMHIDVATASRTIARVSRELATLYPRFIKMPTTQREILTHQEKFYSMFRFPRIIGAVDGTHIRIQSPGGNDAEVFRNRKSFFSLNVQVVCDADMKFENVVARWPGSTHDATIFNNSRLKASFIANEFRNCILIGDSGYPLQEYFMTPLDQPNTRAESLYNESLIRTRNIIERTIGIWKRRFPILAYGMRLKLETDMAIIIATAVLHNIARSMNEPEPAVPADLNLQEINYLIQTQNINMPLNNDHRHNNRINITQREILHYFRNLQ